MVDSPRVDLNQDKKFFTRLNVKGKGRGAPNVTYVIFNDSVDKPPSSAAAGNSSLKKKKKKRRTRSV